MENIAEKEQQRFESVWAALENAYDQVTDAIEDVGESEAFLDDPGLAPDELADASETLTEERAALEVSKGDFANALIAAVGLVLNE